MDDLKQRIRELEKEIEIKDHELDRSHKELLRVNSVIEKLIADYDRDLKWALRLQKALSPTEIPNISGFEFSTKFIPGSKSGGDYFDIFELEDKMRFGIMMSAASGYSMSAMFLSVLIKFSMQIEARRGADPEKVVSLLTHELSPTIESDNFISIFYAVIDRRSFEIRYCSAGNNHGFYLPIGAKNIQNLSPQVGVINKLGDLTGLKSETISLSARDRIVICSEGVGASELIAQVLTTAPRGGVHELRNEILFQSQQQSKLNEPLRDQTAIVIEVQDKVIKLAQRR